MANMAWKQSIEIGNLNAEKALELLEGFNYPTEIDKKGRLTISRMGKMVLHFEPNGTHSTFVGVRYTKMHPLIFILFVLLLIAFVVPGFIFSLIMNSQRKQVFLNAVSYIKNNINNETTTQKSSTPDPIDEKLRKLNSMLKEKLISEEEYSSKKNQLLDNL